MNNDMHAALAGLEINFMTMEELEHAAARGELVIQKGVWGYDLNFQLEYPDHPMAFGRYKRIKAADHVRDIARQMREPFPPEVLSRIHHHMFDCCATVRLSLGKALFHCGDAGSIPFVQDLVRQESESKMVAEQAQKTLTELERRYTK